MYQAQAAEAEAGSGESETSGKKDEAADDVVDAEFEEVKDDKK